MILTFDRASHTYRVDGVVKPSVNQVLTAGGHGVDYGGVAPFTLRRARDRGIYVEQCCRAFDEGRLDVDRVHPDCRPYVAGYVAWVERHGFRAAWHQRPVYHPTLGYCGTPDLGGLRDGPTTLDLKCTSKLAPTYALALAAYTMPDLLRCDADGVLRPIGAQEARLILWLKPTGAQESWCRSVGDYRDFARACEAYHAKAKGVDDGEGQRIAD